MIKLDLWTHYRGIFEKSVRRWVGGRGDSSGNGNGWKAGREEMKGESDDCPVDRAWPKANKRAKLKRQNKQAEPTASTAAKSARKRLDFGHQGNRGKVQDFLILRMALDENVGTKERSSF